MYAGAKYESHYTVWTAWISIRVRVRVRVYFILQNLAPPGTTVHVPTAEIFLSLNFLLHILRPHCVVNHHFKCKSLEGCLKFCHRRIANIALTLNAIAQSERSLVSCCLKVNLYFYLCTCVHKGSTNVFYQNK